MMRGRSRGGGVTRIHRRRRARRRRRFRGERGETHTNTIARYFSTWTCSWLTLMRGREFHVAAIRARWTLASWGCICASWFGPRPLLEIGAGLQCFQHRFSYLRRLVKRVLQCWDGHHLSFSSSSHRLWHCRRIISLDRDCRRLLPLMSLHRVPLDHMPLHLNTGC